MEMKIAQINLRVLSAIAHAASSEKTRYCLCGVKIEVTPESVTYVATDGYVLAAVQELASNTITGEWIIPTGICRRFKFKKEKYEFAELSCGPGDLDLVLAYRSETVKFSAIDETFLDWRRIVPRKCAGGTAQFAADKIVQLAMVRRALAPLLKNDSMEIAHNGPSGPALVNIGEGAIGIIMPFRGEARVELPAWFTAGEQSLAAAE